MNEAVPVTPKVQGNVNKDSQAQQGSTDSTDVYSSIKRLALEDPATLPAKVAIFEMKTSSSKIWELSAGLADYINRKYHVTDQEVKEKILMENSIPSNIKGTTILDNYIIELLLENKRTLTSNHEEALKGIHYKVSHVFGSHLRLWGIIEEEKQAALQELRQNNGA